MDQGTIEIFDDYINDPAKFQILDNDCMLEEEDEQKQEQEKEQKQEVEPSPRRRISIDEFIKKYVVDIYPLP